MKKIIKFATYILILLAVVLSALAIYIASFDLNKYKDKIETTIEKNINADLVIDGDIGLNFFPNIELVINDVSMIKNDKKIFSLEKIEAKLAVMPLFKKEIIIPEIYINKADVVLEKMLIESSGSKIEKEESIVENRIDETSKNIKTTKLDTDELIKKFKLKNLTVLDSSVSYIDGENKQNLKVNNLDISMSETSSDMNIDLDAVYNEKEVKLSTRLDIIQFILEEEFETVADIKIFYDNIDTDFNATIFKTGNDYRIALKGTIFNPKDNYDLPEIKGEVKLSFDDGKISFESDELFVAKKAFKTSLSLDVKSEKLDADIKISGENLDVRDFMKHQNEDSLKEAEEKAKKAVEKSEKTTEFVLPYELLNKYNVKLDVNFDKVVIDNDKVISNLKTQSSLENGVLRIPANFEIADGLFNANVKIAAANNEVVFQLKSDEFILQNLDKKLLVSGSEDFGFKSGGKTKLDISLKTYGDKLPELKSKLNGRAVVILNESEVETGLLSFFEGNIIGDLIKVIPFLSSSKKEKIDLECAVVRADIINGVANFPKSIALSSKKNNLVFDGKINLKNQKLQFMLNPYSNRSFDINVTQVISSFIRIGGSLSKPKVKLAEKKAAFKTWTGVLTSGLSIAGEQLLLQNDPAPCYSALKNTKYQNYFPEPKKTVRNKTLEKKDEAVEKINKEVDRVVDDAKKIIKGLEVLF